MGDLYTDPQIHTMDMKDYGEANLGSKGMALFFSSHLCSPLCSALGLKQFDLSSEVNKITFDLKNIFLLVGAIQN